MKVEFSLYDLTHNLIREMLKYTKSQLILHCPSFNKIYDNKEELSKIIYNLLRNFTDRLQGGRIIFNITKFEEKDELKNNFFQGIPSPAGGCLILFPLMFELSDFSYLLNLKVIVPYFMILISILLISKVPTFSFKKIAIRRNMTIFLLLGVGLFFVSIVQFTFETLTICSLIYLILIPVGIYNYKLKLKTANQIELEDEHQDIL